MTPRTVRGPVYFTAIKARLEDIVRTYGMNSINFDGMYWGQGFGCNQPGHGHLVGQGAEVGVYATERVAETNSLSSSRCAINPKIVLDLFVCNEWASPWWLMQLDGVHTVAGDTLGCDIPSPWLRDELITVRDIQVFDEHRRLQRQFPLWAEDLYGNQVRRDHLIDGVVVTGEDMAARWEDEFTLALAGRGPVQNHIVCSDLEVLAKSAGGLEFRPAGNWVRRTRHLRQLPAYRRRAREAPALRLHARRQNGGIVALRNPWIEPRTFDLRIDERLDLGPVDGPVVVTIVYPYRETMRVAFGDTVQIPLEDYAVMLLDVRTVSHRIAARRKRALDSRCNARFHPDDSALNELPSGFGDAEQNSYRLAGLPSFLTGPRDRFN